MPSKSEGSGGNKGIRDGSGFVQKAFKQCIWESKLKTKHCDMFDKGSKWGIRKPDVIYTT